MYFGGPYRTEKARNEASKKGEVGRKGKGKVLSPSSCPSSSRLKTSTGELRMLK